MTARRKKEKRTPPANAPPRAEISGEEKRRDGRREIWISFVLSLAITAALCGINWLIGYSDFGRQLEEIAYDTLQNSLSSASSAASTGVVVMDISSIPMITSTGLRPGPVTKREPLKFLVDALVQMKNPPKAIGLDVDFSPDEHGYADAADEDLLESFRNAKIPIRVGVHDSLVLGKDKWLNNTKYADLASCVVVPSPESVQTAWYMPEWVDVKYSSAPEDLPARCPAMGVALVHQTTKPVPSGLGWLAETTHQDDSESSLVVAPKFLVDYSQLSKFDQQKIVVPQIQTAHDATRFIAGLDSAKNLDGQIILLGRITNTGDIFIVPGRPLKAYAGVYLHACAAYTLLQKTPLYHLKFPGVLLLDALFSILVFIPVLLIRFYLLNKGKEDFMEYGVAEILSFVVMAALVCFAIWGVRKTHLMWDDFILVAAALIVHNPVEHAVERGVAWLPPSVRSWFHAAPAPSRSHSENAK
jgi:CHASE2 domain-containing sensor protein